VGCLINIVWAATAPVDHDLVWVGLITGPMIASGSMFLTIAVYEILLSGSLEVDAYTWPNNNNIEGVVEGVTLHPVRGENGKLERGWRCLSPLKALLDALSRRSQ
jgi:hypothetical protein